MIENLVNQLMDAFYHYEEGNPIMTDSEFDSLEKKLRLLDPTNEYFNSVGSMRRGKVKLPFPMNGLVQIQVGELDNWIFSQPNSTYYELSHKLDGVSIQLNYSNGVLVSAYSRGDNINGQNVTRHAINIPSIPKNIKFLGELTVRAEIIIEPAKFNAINDNYANPRNFVAGQMNSTKAIDAFYSNVDCIVFEIMNCDSETEINLIELGFRVVPSIEVNSITEQFVNDFLTQAKEESPYELDGVVIKTSYDEVIKYKLNTEFHITTVIDVEWNISRHGVLKPIINFETVNIGGVNISCCTGFNAAFIFNNDIGPGAIIEITRSGDVIPYITNVIKSSECQMPGIEDIDYKWTSLFDISAIKFSSDLYVKKLTHFFTTLNVPGYKNAAAKQLVDSFNFTTVYDLLKWVYEDDCITGLQWEPIKLAIKQAIDKSTWAKFADASGEFESGIGERILTLIVNEIGDKVLNVNDITINDMITIHGIQETTAQKIIDGLSELMKYYSLNDFIIPTLFEKQVSNDMEGVVFEFTGFRNEKLSQNWISRGAKQGSKFNLLVCKDLNSSSSKIKKARDKKIEIISIADAMNK